MINNKFMVVVVGILALVSVAIGAREQLFDPPEQYARGGYFNDGKYSPEVVQVGTNSLNDGFNGGNGPRGQAYPFYGHGYYGGFGSAYPYFKGYAPGFNY